MAGRSIMLVLPGDPPAHSALLAELHDPLVPLLQQVLAAIPLPQQGIALDLGCGPGLKIDLLAGACGTTVRLLGVDRDLLAIRDAHARAGSYWWGAGDALALPLRDRCCAAGFCIAALGLFADKLAALRELRRVISPGGPVLLVVGCQSWARVVAWPEAIAARLSDLYAQVLADHSLPRLPIDATPDLGGELALLLESSGFAGVHVRAFLLTAVPHPLHAELPLLPWATLRTVLADRLSASERARYDQIAAAADLNLCSLALFAWARSPDS